MRLKSLIPLGLKTSVRRWLLCRRLRGDRFECPMCGSRFSAMLPCGLDLPVVYERQIVGAGRRENAQCPRCNSSDRERLIHQYLIRRTEIFSGHTRVLHVAPERCLQRVLKSATSIEYTSADLTSPLAMVKMDITDIQFPDGCFDAIICNHVLEHIPDDHQAMREILRVLRPGGWAILQVPISLNLETTHEDPSVTDPRERERQFAQSDHVRLYAAEDFVARLTTSGFTVSVVDFANEIDARERERFALDPRERIFIGVKPMSADPIQGVNP